VLNRRIWFVMHERAKNDEFNEVRGSFLHGIEEFISSPVQTELISLEELTNIQGPGRPGWATTQVYPAPALH
jgi:hypothetical protein